MNLCESCSADSRYCGHNPDYSEAADCLMSLYDATSKAVSTMARGTRSKADRFEISGIVMLTTFLAKASCVDLDGAFDASVEEGEPDPRRANRALLDLNERLLKSVSCLMLVRTKATPEARELLVKETFERFQIRHLYACAMAYATAAGVKVEG